MLKRTFLNTLMASTMLAGLGLPALAETPLTGHHPARQQRWARPSPFWPPI